MVDFEPVVPTDASAHRSFRSFLSLLTSRYKGALVRKRWPTALAVAIAGASFFDWSGGLELAFLVPLATTSYLAVAVLRRPSLVWGAVAVSIAGYVAMSSAGLRPWPILLLVAAAMYVDGIRVGRLREGLARWQGPVALLVVTAAIVTPTGWAAAVGVAFLAHAAWDLAHWRANEVVSRPFAEWCGVFDLLIGIAILASA